MTISNTKAKSVYETNGERREWEIGFDFDSNVSKLNIILEDREGYQTIVEDNYLIEDGVVIYPSLESELDPIAEGYKIILIRETENNQEIDYRDNIVEQGLDKLTLQIQEIAEEVDRAIKVPVSEEGLSKYKNPVLEIREETKKSLNEIKEATSVVSDYTQASSASANIAKEEADRAVEASNTSVMASADAEAFATKAENLANEAHNAVSAYVNGLGAMRNAVIDLGLFEDNQRKSSSCIIDFDFEPLDVFVRFSDSEKKMWIKGSHSFAGIEKVGDKKYKIFYSISSEDFASQSAIKGPFYVQYVIKYSIFSGKPVVYRGRVDSVDQLPAEAEDGDLWYVGPIEQENKEEYVWQGGKWELLGSTDFTNIYTKEEIDNKVKVIEVDIDANADAIQKTRNDFIEADSELQQQINAHAEELTTQKNDIDELGDQVSEIESKIPEGTSDTNPLINKQQLLDEEMDIRADMMESDSELQTQINALAEAIQGGGGGSAEVPDNVYTQDNLVAGDNIEIKEVVNPNVIDDNTLLCWHFDEDDKDVINGTSAGVTIQNDYYKFGTGSAVDRFQNSNVTLAQTITDTTDFTADFWIKGVDYGAENAHWELRFIGNGVLYLFTFGRQELLQVLNPNYESIGTIAPKDTVNRMEWNHYAWTYRADKRMFTCYINGVSQGTLIIPEAQKFSLTVLDLADANYAVHRIDELRITKSLAWEKDFTPPTAPYTKGEGGAKKAISAIIPPVELPSDVYRQSNLLGGKDIEIVKKSGGIDENTLACWHFEGTINDEVNGTPANSNPATLVTDYAKFGTGSLNAGITYTSITKDTTAPISFDFWGLVPVPGISSYAQFWLEVEDPSYGQKWIRVDGIAGSKLTVAIMGGATVTTDFTVPRGQWVHYYGHYVPETKMTEFFANGTKIFSQQNANYHGATTFDLSKSGVCRFDEIRISKSIRWTEDFTPPEAPYEAGSAGSVINFTGKAGGSGKNIGEVYYSQSSLASDNAGSLPLFTGETIASANTIYPDFYSWVESHTELQTTAEEYESALTTYGECPKYVVSNGSLRLPKLTNYIKVANTSEGITQSEAGLPNITGSLRTPATNESDSSGAFKTTTPVTGDGLSGLSNGSLKWNVFSDFDASRSSEVYGKSDTVTPSHTTLYPWVYAYSSAIEASTAQAAEFQEGLSGKSDLDLSNSTPSANFKKNSIGWLMPDYSASVAVTMPYTAPYSGWFVATAVNANTDVKINNVKVAMISWDSGRWSGNLNCQILVSKGDVITGAVGDMFFIPCKGETL